MRTFLYFDCIFKYFRYFSLTVHFHLSFLQLPPVPSPNVAVCLSLFVLSVSRVAMCCLVDSPSQELEAGDAPSRPQTAAVIDRIEVG